MATNPKRQLEIVNKPYDAEIEYLESTGTQWINTGVSATNNTRVDVHFSDYTIFHAWLFGARRAYQDGALGVYAYIQEGTNYRWIRSFGSLTSTSFSVPSSGVSIFDYDCGHFIAINNGTKVADFTDTSSAFDSSPYSIYLWTVNLAGAPGNISTAKIYSVGIYQNGTLVRDLIPVRFTNEQGQTEGAMYDKRGVGGIDPDGTPRDDGLYRNQGTGSFVLGPDIKHYMVIDAKHKLATARKPYDAEIEYLESTGTQWIDTGIAVGPNLQLQCAGQYKYRSTSMMRGSGSIDGGTTKYNIFILTGSGNNGNYSIQAAYNQSGTGTPLNLAVPLSFGDWFTAKLTNRALVVNGQTVSTSSYQIPECSQTIGIFGYTGPTGSVSVTAGGLITSAQIWKSNTLVRDFIPVRFTNEQGQSEGALYDKVTNQLFRNQGTGAFQFGNDVAYPPNIITYRKPKLQTTPTTTP